MGAGVWLVDIGVYPMVREEFPTHLAAAERAAELERKGARHVVCWFCEDYSGPWVERAVAS